MISKISVITVLLFTTGVFSAPTSAGTSFESHVVYADAFNSECTGAVTSEVTAFEGEEAMPDPLEVERLLKEAVLVILGLEEGNSRAPSYSSMQTDLELLNVSPSVDCKNLRWLLEQEYHVYGIKAWIQRAGASSYLLIRRSSQRPQAIHLKTYYTW